MSISDYPVTLLPIKPYASDFYVATASTLGMIPGGSGASFSTELLLEASGVELHGDGAHQAFFIIANFLDRPLSLSEVYVGHGWQYLQPGIVDIPLKSPDTPVTRLAKVIPGQTESMIPDTPDTPSDSTISDVDTFGVGVFMTGKDGIFRGTEAALSFTTTDSRVPTTIAVAACITAGGGGLYRACTMDLSAYGTLQGFHDATVDDSKDQFSDSANGVFMQSSATHACDNTGGLDLVNSSGAENGNIGVFTFFIGPVPG